jgi:hypothetical protein
MSGVSLNVPGEINYIFLYIILYIVNYIFKDIYYNSNG